MYRRIIDVQGGNRIPKRFHNRRIRGTTQVDELEVIKQKSKRIFRLFLQKIETKIKRIFRLFLQKFETNDESIAQKLLNRK